MLWYNILQNTDAVSTYQDISDFAVSTTGSSPYRFASALVAYKQAFVPEASWQADWLELTGRKKDVDLRVQSIYTLISSSQEGQEVVYFDSLELYQRQSDSLNNLMGNLQEQFDTLKNSRLQVLQSTVNTLPDTATWEQAWKIILNSAINRAKGSEPSENERNALLTIAGSCHELVGNANQVVLSFMVPEDAEPYLGREHENPCNNPVVQPGANRMKPNEPAALLSLSPNPARDMVSIRTSGKSAGDITLFTVTGEQVTRVETTPGETITNLDISALKPGMYFLRFKDREGTIMQQRLIVAD